MAQKTFVGSGRSKSPKWLKATIPEKALRIMLENMQEYQGSKFAKIDINILPEPNKFGKDVELTLDTWTPSGEKKPEPQAQQQPTTTTASVGDLPF